MGPTLITAISGALAASQLKSLVAGRYSPLAEDWTFSGKKWGWALRLKYKKRAVLYMTPCRGHFLVGFALGEKAVEAAHRSELPASVLEVIDSARKYAEGRAVRLEIRSREDVGHVETIAVAKMST